MPTQDALQIKEKIISILKRRGPSLPVHIAKEIETSILFTSAFLSELASEKRLKISYIKVGSSPVYYLQDQEQFLDKFSQYLKSKERDAYLLLKEKKFLEDKSQEPAIRVALRSIRDFAIPFKKNNELFWHYYTVPESEFKLEIIPEQAPEIVIKKEEEEKIKTKEETPKEPIIIAPKITKTKSEKQKDLEIFDKKPIKPKTIKKPQISKPKKIKISKKSSTNEKFFNNVKEALNAKSIEIIDILGFSKSDLILKVKDSQGEKILVVYNKKRISESDISRANKKALEFGLPYTILSLGEPTKKIRDFIEAIKNLSSMEKI